MDLLRWMGLTFARFVGLTVIILGVWTFVANVVHVADRGTDWWVTVWILASGLAGAVGGTLFMLSLDGPDRFRTRRFRMVAWALMILATLLPTNLRPMMLPLVLATVYTLFYFYPLGEAQEPVTSG